MNATNRWRWIGLCALPLLAGADNVPPRPQRDLARENADLRAYVDELEEKVRKLQDEVRDLRRLRSAQPEYRIVPAPPRTAPPRLAPPVPPQPPRRFDGDIPTVPDGPRVEPFGDRRNWQERRFNGGTFYVIPLEPADLATPPARP